MAFAVGSSKWNGITGGIVSNDAEALYTQVTVHCWYCRMGVGETVGRIWDHSDVGSSGLCTAAGETRLLASALRYYSFEELPFAQWVPVTCIYDTSVSTNDPTVWLDGVKLTVGAGITQLGADDAWVTTSNKWAVGQRSDSATTRYADGFIADFAVWNTLLTDSEAQYLHAGNRVDGNIRPANLRHYLPFKNNVSARTPLLWTERGLKQIQDPRQLLNSPMKKYFSGTVAAPGSIDFFNPPFAGGMYSMQGNFQG